MSGAGVEKGRLVRGGAGAVVGEVEEVGVEGGRGCGDRERSAELGMGLRGRRLHCG